MPRAAGFRIVFVLTTAVVVGGCAPHGADDEPAQKTQDGRPVEPPPPPRPPAPVVEQPPEPEGPRCFAQARRFQLGGRASTGVMVDLDGDGHLDVVASEGLGARTVVMAADGEGGFVPRAEVEGHPESFSMVAGDFDEDGHADVLTANPRTRSISLLPGDGRGAFGDRIDRSVGFGPHATTAADLDGDGHLDLVMARLRAISILRGRGDGTFDAPRSQRTGQAPEHFAWADVDGDTRSDLLAPSNDAQVLTVHRGRRGARLGPAEHTECGQNPLALAVGDFDGDSHVDVALHASTHGEVCLMRGDGDGSFTVYERLALADSWVLAAHDVDADGALDLLAMDQGDLLTFRGDGHGSFEPWARTHAAADVRNLWLHDVDGDERTDAVLLHTGGPTFTARPDGTWEPSAELIVLAGRSCAAG